MAVIDYLNRLKATTKREDFEAIVEMVEEDIKFNNIGFGRTTTGEDFIRRCMICHATYTRC